MRRWKALSATLLIALTLAGCVLLGPIGNGDLRGHLYVQWIGGNDEWIYRVQPKDPLSFKPSFLSVAITPKDMYTDGGSIPQVFRSIDGLSPWGLGPAYIMHDWLFEVHRCPNRQSDPTIPQEVKNITFEQSAQVLAETAKYLIDAGLSSGANLDAIRWAIETNIARRMWDRPPEGNECALPTPAFIASRMKANAIGRPLVVADWTVPRVVRR